MTAIRVPAIGAHHILWSDETWQTCPLVSGVGIQDKHSVMPDPAQTGPDWG